jgi:hypothetical protein
VSSINRGSIGGGTDDEVGVYNSEVGVVYYSLEGIALDGVECTDGPNPAKLQAETRT